MAMTITANAYSYLNVSPLEENGSFFQKRRQKSLFLHAFSNSRNSRKLVRLHSMKSRTKVIFCLKLNTKESSSGDGALGMGFEFKPSFDQYLKVMESVKTERGRKKFDRSTKDKVDEDGGGGSDSVRSSSEVDDDVPSRSLESESGTSSETSVAAANGDGFRRRKLKREVVDDKYSSDKSKRKDRSSKKEELGLAVARNGTLERYDSRSDNVVRSSRRVPSRIDDDDDNDRAATIEIPAFKFSDESCEVVDKPPVSDMEMDDRIEKLARGLNGADINMPEWLFSKAIRSARIRYSDHTIMKLIQILGKLGNWRRILQVIEWLQRQERFKSNKLRIIYTMALSALGKSKRPVEALNVFRTMQQQMSSYPDMVSYRSIAVTLGQAGHIKELFDVIDTMRSPPKRKFKTSIFGKWDPRLDPDIVVYNAVLNACVQRKQWEGAFWVLQQLRQKGQKPSAATYGLVMEVMYSCGKYNLVHEFFEKMKKSSIPNALAYRVVVNTLWKEGKIDEAAQLVEEMEHRGVVGSAALYYDLSRCLCSVGRCDEGLNLMSKICRVANKPLVVTYTGLIQACLDSGNVHNAAYIFDQMKRVCSPNLVSCNIMIKAYLNHGLFKEARELFEDMSDVEMNKSRVLPDTYTFNSMLDAYFEARKWNDFEVVYLQMLRHGFHFNAKRHLRMVLEASRAGKEGVMEATWEHLRGDDRMPPTALIKERFCKKVEKGDIVSAISLVSDLENSGFSRSAWMKLLKENEFRFPKDSILRLRDDAGEIVARSEALASGSVLNNLLCSCKEFLRNTKS